LELIRSDQDALGKKKKARLEDGKVTKEYRPWVSRDGIPESFEKYEL